MPNNKPGSRLIKAAGAVAWRPGPDGEPEVLLVHRKKYDDWSLPKGKTEPGEPLPVTAVREVLEEGGARLALGRRLVSVRYKVGGRPKRVHYWASRVLSVDERAVPNHEVDEIAWVPAGRAVEQVSYVHDHGVLADFAARPVKTVPLVLLRHAKAVAKGSWKRSDSTRPLDDSGRSDAKALADLLACFAPAPRLISSPAVRCTETVRPFAELSGATVREERFLYVHTQISRAELAREVDALIREAIASGEPTVICAHRENLPDLQDAALTALAGHPAAEIPAAALPGASGEGLAGGPIADIPGDWDDDLPTAGFWVLNIAPFPAAEAPGEPAPQALAAPAAAPGVLEPDPEPAVLEPAAPPPARRWWQFARPRPAATAVGGLTAASAAASDPLKAATPADSTESQAESTETQAGIAETQTETPPAPSVGPAPSGVLISADRYDLAEA